MFDIGAPGRCSDGGIFHNSKMGEGFDKKQMNLPPPRRISPNRPKLPCFMVGDEGFPLKDYMMRPFPRRCALDEAQLIFNYRLYRGRRTSECAFGILVRRFQIFKGPMHVRPNLAMKIVQAAVCLHNFILSRQKPIDL